MCLVARKGEESRDSTGDAESSVSSARVLAFVIKILFAQIYFGSSADFIRSLANLRLFARRDVMQESRMSFLHGRG